MKPQNSVLSALATTAMSICLLITDVYAAPVSFTVTLKQSLSSRTAKPGQTVHARLIKDLHQGKTLLAPAGSDVIGKVTGVDQSRRLLRAEVSTKRWLHAGGGVNIQFNKIVPPHGAAVAIKAVPVDVVGGRQETGKRKNDLKVSHGEVEGSRKRDLKPKAARTVLGVAALVGAPFTAVAGGVAGAIKPSVVLPEADTAKAAKHRRLKGMATGIVAGLPGGFLVNDAVLKGGEVTLPAGTQLQLQWDH